MSVVRVSSAVVLVIVASAVMSPGAPAAEAPRRVALLVGVEHYHKPGFRDLRFCEDDVIAVGQELTKLGFEVTVLLGSAEGDQQATKANIERVARQIVAPLGKQDIALVMLSGHGQQLDRAPDSPTPPQGFDFDSSDSYFCPVDARLNDPRSQVSLSYLLDDVLALDVGRKMLLVDACRDVPADPSARGKNAKGIEGRQIRLREGTAVYFSCSAGQQSFEKDELGHGLFTHCVLEALRGEAASAAGEISWSRLVAHVDDRMSHDDLTRLMPGELRQMPIASGALPQTVLGRIDVARDGTGPRSMPAVGAVRPPVQSSVPDAAAVLAKAKTAVENSPDANARIECYRRIALAESAVGNLAAAQEYFALAIDAAQWAEHASSSLWSIASDQRRAGLTTESTATLRQALDALSGSGSYFTAIWLSDELLSNGDAGSARRAVDKARDFAITQYAIDPSEGEIYVQHKLRERASAWQRIAVAMARVGDLPAAKKLIHEIWSLLQHPAIRADDLGSYRDSIITSMATAQAGCGEPETALQTLKSVSNRAAPLYSLTQIAGAQCRAGNLAGALRTVAQIKVVEDELSSVAHDQARALVEIAKAERDAGHAAAALEQLNAAVAVLNAKQSQHFSNDYELASVLFVMDDVGQPADVIRVAQQINSKSDAATWLLRVAEEKLLAGDAAYARPLLAAAVQAAGQINDEGGRAAALARIVYLQARAGDPAAARSLTAALRAIESVPESHAHMAAESRVDTAVAQAWLGQITEALAAVDAFTDLKLQVNAWCGIAEALAKRTVN